MDNSAIKAAFVSTNSISQGEQVAILWKPLFEQFSIHIDFAYRTFRWDSEATQKRMFIVSLLDLVVFKTRRKRDCLMLGR